VWDPASYLRYGDERGRPFFDLVGRIDAGEPGDIVDLGCGPGTLTVHLARRWPTARVRGLDSSPEMIESARGLGSTVEFEVADVRDWHAGDTVGVVVANAVLQWVPDHLDLLRRWAGELRPRAVLAFQVPGQAFDACGEGPRSHFTASSHRALREVAARPRWRDRVPEWLREPGSVLDPREYAIELTRAGCLVDAWETTYVHLLPATGTEHPVLAWMEGTALRPVRAALDDADWAGFRAELQDRLAAEYPAEDGLVYFPFRRVFVVARIKPAATEPNQPPA
jgi:trans-aconitate 2-methyltransferase